MSLVSLALSEAAPTHEGVCCGAGVGSQSQSRLASLPVTHACHPRPGTVPPHHRTARRRATKQTKTTLVS